MEDQMAMSEKSESVSPSRLMRKGYLIGIFLKSHCIFAFLITLCRIL